MSENFGSRALTPDRLDPYIPVSLLALTQCEC